MTHVSIVTDPVYMTEPLIKSEDHGFDTSEQASWLWPCEPVVEVVRPKGVVPSYLPGENPFLHEFSQRWGLPYRNPLAAALKPCTPSIGLKLKENADRQAVAPTPPPPPTQIPIPLILSPLQSHPPPIPPPYSNQSPPPTPHPPPFPPPPPPPNSPPIHPKITTPPILLVHLTKKSRGGLY